MRPKRDDKLAILDEIGTALELYLTKFSKSLSEDELNHVSNMKKSFDVLHQNALDDPQSR